MNIYGYAKTIDPETLLNMNEVTIAADPGVLRDFARFVEAAAGEMEKYGDEFGHEHMRDNCDSWKEGYPDIIITKHV